MKRIFKSLFIFILIVGCFIFNISNSKALTEHVFGSSIEALEIPNNYNVKYLSSDSSPKDYLHYFTDDRTDWQPRIKYTGNKNSIINYVFCLTFHKKAPNDVDYTKNLEGDTIKDEYYAYASIIENGFGSRNYTLDTYDDLLWDYYITSLAIWQYQYKHDLMDQESKAKFEDIESFEGDDTAKTAILNLVTAAESNDKTKFIVPYKASDDQYQEITPNIVYQISNEVSITHSCSIIGSDYYDINGNKVSKEEYEKSCKSSVTADDPYSPPTPTRYSCEIVNGIYYDAKGNGVTKEIYENSCGIKKEPEPYTPQPEPKEENPETAVDSYLYAGLGLAGLIPTYLYLRKKKKFIKIK